MKLSFLLKRHGGIRVIEYLSEDGRSVCYPPIGAWRHKRCEQGGYPFGGGASAIAKLAAAMVEQRLTGGEPVPVPAGMSPADVLVAARIAEAEEAQ